MDRLIDQFEEGTHIPWYMCGVRRQLVGVPSTMWNLERSSHGQIVSQDLYPLSHAGPSVAFDRC